MKKVLVAMSGGVDSSVVALKLKQSGFLCCGATAIMYNSGQETPIYLSRAQKVCKQLGIEHVTLDYREEFKEKVIKPFIKTYEKGATPNPCILCNIYFKFGKLFEYAKNNNFDYFATGHYARVCYDSLKKRWLLKKSKNKDKDQTYFLYFLQQEQLEKILFLLEDLDKDVVKQIAKENGFESYKIKESQDICFVEGKKYSSFIREHTRKEWPQGNFVDVSGQVLGKHNGIINYTIGQRKGIGLSFKEPMFVQKIDFLRNEVVLSKEEELFTKIAFAKNLRFICKENLKDEFRCSLKIRYRQKEEEAIVFRVEKDLVKIVFEKKQRAVAKGQAVVFYSGEDVLGGGELC